MAQLLQIKMLNQNKVVELRNNFIQKATIKAAFLLADNALVSLFYRRDEIQISCAMNEAGTIFFLPNEWPSMEFTVESNYVPSRPSNPADMEAQFTTPFRPKRLISPFGPNLLPDLAPSSEDFLKWMYYLDEHPVKSTAIIVHSRFAVTFRHGTHQQLNLEDTMRIYWAGKEVEDQAGKEVRVVKIHEALDFILLKSEVDLVVRGPPIAEARDFEPFTLAGFGNENGYLSFLPGAIHYVRDYIFGNGIRNMGPFILGTCQSSRGYLGGGIWGARGLIDMNLGCTTMPLKHHHEAIAEAATFSAKNIICPAFHFKLAFLEELAKENNEDEVAPPPKKKAFVETEIEGIGKLVGRET